MQKGLLSSTIHSKPIAMGGTIAVVLGLAVGIAVPFLAFAAPSGFSISNFTAGTDPGAWNFDINYHEDGIDLACGVFDPLNSAAYISDPSSIQINSPAPVIAQDVSFNTQDNTGDVTAGTYTLSLDYSQDGGSTICDSVLLGTFTIPEQNLVANGSFSGIVAGAFVASATRQIGHGIGNVLGTLLVVLAGLIVLGLAVQIIKWLIYEHGVKDYPEEKIRLGSWIKDHTYGRFKKHF